MTSRASIAFLGAALIAAGPIACAKDNGSSCVEHCDDANHIAATAERLDGSTYHVCSYCQFEIDDQGDDVRWHMLARDDCDDMVVSVGFYQSEVTAPGEYDAGVIDPIFIGAGWAFPEVGVTFGVSGTVRFTKVGYNQGDTIAGGYDLVELSVSDDEESFEMRKLTDGTFNCVVPAH
jgi:hypothetical protein